MNGMFSSQKQFCRLFWILGWVNRTAPKHFGSGKRNAGIHVGTLRCTKWIPWNESTQPCKDGRFDQFLCPQLASLSCVLSDGKVFVTEWQVWQTPARQLFVTETELCINLSVNSEHPSVHLSSLDCFPELFTSQQALHWCVLQRRWDSLWPWLPPLFFWPGMLRSQNALRQDPPKGWLE